MSRCVCLGAVFVFASALAAAAQSSGSDASSSQSPPSAQAPKPAEANDSSPPKTANKDPKKPKKVWTNEDVGSLNGPVSVVGDPKNAKPQASRGAAHDSASSLAARYKEELQRLRAQLEQADKQISDLKNFNAGETSGSAGLQLHRGYNTVPIPDQIKQLEAKKKKIQERIDQLEDEARKRGIEPGQLR